MATPSDPTPGRSADATEPPGAPSLPPSSTPDQPTEPRRRPWTWIALCGGLAVIAVGLTIWALSLQSDLDDQRDQTAAAQQQADKASSEVDQLTQDVNDAIDQAGQAGAAAKDKLQGALADLKERLGALGEETTPPAEGSGTPEAAATPAGTPAVATATGTPPENATPDAR